MRGRGESFFVGADLVPPRARLAQANILAKIRIGEQRCEVQPEATNGLIRFWAFVS